jgi:hypothetical protein
MFCPTERTDAPVGGAAVRTVHVPMLIESVRRVPDPTGQPIYQVSGFVGDYSISIWMDENEAKAAGVAALAQ